MPVVRCSASFFERLDELLPEARTTEGGPSATDFLLYDLAPIRDLLAADLIGMTSPAVPDGGVRVYVGAGVLVNFRRRVRTVRR